jgi:hypothetical protein
MREEITKDISAEFREKWDTAQFFMKVSKETKYTSTLLL